MTLRAARCLLAGCCFGGSAAALLPELVCREDCVVAALPRAWDAAVFPL